MKRREAYCCAWLAAFAIAAAGSGAEPVLAQPPAIAAGLPIPAPPGQSVAVADDPSARIGVPVTIGGKSWNFLIDSASTRSVIASDVADSLALARGGDLRILSIAGTETVPSVIIPDVGFSDFAVRDIHAPVLLRSNLGGDGLLGLDILRNRKLSIDFRRATTLTISISSPAQDRREDRDDPGAIVVVGRSRFGELVVTNAEIDGTAVAVILDTGSEDSIGNPALASMLAHNSARSRFGAATLLSVTGRSLPGNYGVIDRLRIGGLTVEDVPIVFGDVATFRQFKLIGRPAILLGMDTLRLFARVTIDFPRHQIKLWLRTSARERGAI